MLEILFDLFAEGLFELLLEFPLSRYKKRRDRQNHPPVLAAVGYLLLGVVAGAISAWAVPRQQFPATGMRGVSLLLSPLGAGLLMEWWGRRRRARGHSTTSLATWYGGAAFAFGAAAARFFLLE